MGCYDHGDSSLEEERELLKKYGDSMTQKLSGSFCKQDWKDTPPLRSVLVPTVSSTANVLLENQHVAIYRLKGFLDKEALSALSVNQPGKGQREEEIYPNKRFQPDAPLVQLQHRARGFVTDQLGHVGGDTEDSQDPIRIFKYTEKEIHA